MDPTTPDDPHAPLPKAPAWHDALAEPKRHQQQKDRAEKVSALSNALTFAQAIETFLRKVVEIAGMLMFFEEAHAREPGGITRQLIALAAKNAIGEALSEINPATVEAHLGTADRLASELAVLAKNPTIPDFEHRVRSAVEHWAMSLEVSKGGQCRPEPIL